MSAELAEVERRIEMIRAASHDPERAHGMEDALWADVLEHIATEQTDDPAAVATAALKTMDVKFERWCA